MSWIRIARPWSSNRDVWPDEYDDFESQYKRRVEDCLHADPANAAQLEYVRLHSGFCRQITVTPSDLERLVDTRREVPPQRWFTSDLAPAATTSLSAPARWPSCRRRWPSVATRRMRSSSPTIALPSRTPRGWSTGSPPRAFAPTRSPCLWRDEQSGRRGRRTVATAARPGGRSPDGGRGGGRRRGGRSGRLRRRHLRPRTGLGAGSHHAVGPGR